MVEESSLRTRFISGASQPVSESSSEPVRDTSGSFFQPVSESDPSKGVSSLETPTSSVEVEQIERTRKRRSRSRTETVVVDVPVSSVDVSVVEEVAPPVPIRSDPDLFGAELIDVVREPGPGPGRRFLDRLPGFDLQLGVFDSFSDFLDEKIPGRGERKKLAPKIEDLKTEFGAGFGAGTGLVSDPVLVGRVQSGAGTFGEETGLLLGGLTFATGGEIVKGAQAGVTGVRGAVQGSRVGQVITGTRAGRFGAGLGEAFFETGLIIEGGQLLGRGRLTPEEREFVGSDAFGEAFVSGRETEETALKETGFQVGERFISPRGILYEWVGGFTGGRKGREAFEAGVRESLEAQGLTPEDVSLGAGAAVDLRRAGAVSEVAALLNIGRFSERFGRSETARTFEDLTEKGLILEPDKGLRNAFKQATIVAPGIGTAGFIEGSAQEFGQQLLESQGLSPAQIVQAGSVGAVSASAVGGAIGGFSATSPRFSGTVEVGASILDPFEKPGDILEDVREAIVGGAGGGVPSVPVVVTSVDEGFGEISGFGLQSGSKKDLGPGDSFSVSPLDTGGVDPSIVGGGPVISPGDSFAFVDSLDPVTDVSFSSRGRSNIPSVVTPTPSSIPGISSPSIVPITEQTIVPTDPITPVPVPAITDVFAEVPTSAQTPATVLTNVLTNVLTTTTVPVTVPTKGFLPPFMLPRGSPGFSLGVSKASRKTAPTPTIVQSALADTGFVEFEQFDNLSEVTGLFLRGQPGRKRKKKGSDDLFSSFAF